VQWNPSKVSIHLKGEVMLNFLQELDPQLELEVELRSEKEWSLAMGESASCLHSPELMRMKLGITPIARRIAWPAHRNGQDEPASWCCFSGPIKLSSFTHTHWYRNYRAGRCESKSHPRSNH